MEIFMLFLIFSVVVGVVGSSRKIGFFGAFILSFLLSPIIGLIITLNSKNIEREAYEKEILEVQKEQKNVLEELTKVDDTSTPQSSITDELTKLNKLKENKTITEVEYEKLKDKIINS
jgi:phosphotransferase system  glucose/maltose/N-acetylglucosamine-specific IIC component